MESPPLGDYIELESGEHPLGKRLMNYILWWWRQTTRYEWLNSNLSRRSVIFPSVVALLCVCVVYDISSCAVYGVGCDYLPVDMCTFVVLFVAVYLIPRTSLWLDVIVCSTVVWGLFDDNSQVSEVSIANFFLRDLSFLFNMLFLMGIHTVFIAASAATYCLVSIMVFDSDGPAPAFSEFDGALCFLLFLPLMVLSEYRNADAAVQISWAESILQNALSQQQQAFDEVGYGFVASLGSHQNGTHAEFVRGENLVTHSGVYGAPLNLCSPRNRFIDEAGDCHTELSKYSASILSYDSVLQQILHDVCNVKSMEPLLTEEYAQDLLIEAKNIWDLIGAQSSYERRRAVARSFVQRLNSHAIEEFKDMFDPIMFLNDEVVARREELDQRISFENAYDDRRERLRQDTSSAEMVFRSSGALQKIKIYTSFETPLYIVCDMLGGPRPRPHVGKFIRLQGILTRAAISAQIGEALAARI